MFCTGFVNVTGWFLDGRGSDALGCFGCGVGSGDGAGIGLGFDLGVGVEVGIGIGVESILEFGLGLGRRLGLGDGSGLGVGVGSGLGDDSCVYKTGPDGSDLDAVETDGRTAMLFPTGIGFGLTGLAIYEVKVWVRKSAVVATAGPPGGPADGGGIEKETVEMAGTVAVVVEKPGNDMAVVEGSAVVASLVQVYEFGSSREVLHVVRSGSVGNNDGKHIFCAPMYGCKAVCGPHLVGSNSNTTLVKLYVRPRGSLFRSSTVEVMPGKAG